MLSLLDGQEKIYLSFDIVYKISVDEEIGNILYPIEFLNSLKFNGVPNHDLRLKIDDPIVLL